MATTKGRTTATFEPYFWDAYNEIAQPHRFDWYLITRWLPELGPEGFAVVKALRNLCYHNPSTGALRDTCQLTMDELSEMVGMKRASLYRLFDGNAALAAFVQKQPDVVFVEGRTRRLPPRFRVCMDTPIHPDDLERYHALQVEKREDEADRRKSQYEIYERRKSQRAGRKSQNPERKSQGEITSSGISLPPDSLLKEHTPAAVPSHKCVPPEGEGKDTCPLTAAWNQALGLLAGRVNKPTLEAHLRSLHIASVAEDGAVLLLAPHAATRDWIEKRHLPVIEEALSQVLGQPVSVRLRLIKELQSEIAASLGQ